MQQPERTPRFCAFCGCALQLLEVDVSHLLDVTRRAARATHPPFGCCLFAHLGFPPTYVLGACHE